MPRKDWHDLPESTRRKFLAATERRKIKKLSGPVRQLSREEIERLYGPQPVLQDSASTRPVGGDEAGPPTPESLEGTHRSKV